MLQTVKVIRVCTVYFCDVGRLFASRQSVQGILQCVITSSTRLRFTFILSYYGNVHCSTSDMTLTVVRLLINFVRTSAKVFTPHAELTSGQRACFG